ncbi:MAG TPA: hypothetical protein PKH39_00970 [Woeseiaceae bacterium]|nr:hypothetical protein [Woeseiaceae bacterium]
MRPPAECRSPAGYLTERQDVGCTPTPHLSAHARLPAKLTHEHYPLPLAIHNAGYSHRFVAIPDVSRTREAGLAWITPGRY